jgi:S-adenosylmethionine:tRNA ribosyltransferase-isomerase
MARTDLSRKEILIKEFNYDLPEDRIARYPLANRDSSKLLIYKNGNISQDIFSNISSLLSEPALLVRNNTRVIQARLLFVTPENYAVELFLLEPVNESIELALHNKSGKIHFQVLIGNKRKWKEKYLTTKYHDTTVTAELISQVNNEFVIELKWKEGIIFSAIINELGHTPLPPYLKRSDIKEDKENYQTVYSKVEGSVAAPTAGLHFTNSVIEKLLSQKHTFTDLTLHVGAGTFKPVQVENALDHEMHSEEIHVSIDSLIEIKEALLNNKKIIAVGTTSCRTLESLYGFGMQLLSGKHTSGNQITLTQFEIYKFENISALKVIEAIISYLKQNKYESVNGKTQLMIKPSFTFKLVDILITNFHQPSSTLLLLVAAFIGDDWKKVYDYAFQNEFRFLSYGDSSILFRK